jgi:hypothetical protein
MLPESFIRATYLSQMMALQQMTSNRAKSLKYFAAVSRMFELVQI